MQSASLVVALCVLVCLPVCGFVSGNRARTPARASASRTPPFGRRGIPREMADSRVLATARHIHICLRVAVLRDSSNFRGFRPANGPKQSRAWHLWSSSSREEYPRLRYRSTRRCSRVFRSPSASLCCVAGIPAPCLTRACRRNPRTASPRVTPLSARPLSPLPHYMLNPFKPPQQLLINLLG